MAGINNPDYDAVIKRAIERAQQQARSIGHFEVDSVVAHPSDRLAYLFARRAGEEAVVYLPKDKAPDGKPVLKTFPFSELFDPNTARDFAVKEVFFGRIDN